MGDGARKFDPLSEQERKAEIPTTVKGKPSSQIVLPVPADAPPPPQTHVSLGVPIRIHRYVDTNGETLHYVYVFPPRRSGGKKIVLPLTYREIGEDRLWDWKGYPKDHLLPIYGLDRLAAHPDADVLFFEGEKCADVGAELFKGDRSIVAVSTMGGAEAGHRADLEPVRGRVALMHPDNDPPGIKFAKGLADRLIEMDCAVSIVDPAKIIEGHGQGLDPDGLDIADLPLSAELAADVRAFAVPYEGDSLKGLNKAEPAAIDAFIGMMKVNPKLRPGAAVLQALAAMPDFDFHVLVDRLITEAGLTKTAVAELKAGVKAARKKKERKTPIDLDGVDPTKMLLIDRTNPNQTAAAAYEFIVKGGEVYHSVVAGKMVRLSKESGDSTVAISMNSDGLRIVLHNACRPSEIKQEGGMVVQMDCEVADTILRAIMNYYGAAALKPLRGVSASPKLSEDGSIDCSRGYDERLGVFFEGVEGVLERVPPNPAEQDAKDALRRIRWAFRPLPYSDAVTILNEKGIRIVDVDQPARLDESVFLTQLLGAVIRASIKHCPGLMIKSARNSGSGTGKGLAARCLIVVSLRRKPGSYPKNDSTQNELDKTLVTALRDAPSFLFLDNYNDIQLSSSILEGVLTEDSKARMLGVSQAADLSAAVFVVITGNGVSIKGDTARRIVESFFDAQVEKPAERDFGGWDLQADVTRDRDAILADLLTIWRWGRQNKIKPGISVGTFEEWGRWARDPLVALGCMDAAMTMRRNMENDPGRETEISVFRTWWARHKGEKLVGSDLDDEVLAAIGPKCTRKNAPYYLAARLANALAVLFFTASLASTPIPLRSTGLS